MKIFKIITIIITFIIISGSTYNKSYIEVLPYTGINPDLVNYVYKELLKVYPNVIIKPYENLPNRAYYKPRKRYRADTIIDIQSINAKSAYILGLTDKDISTTSGNYYDWGIFGLAYCPGNSSIVSTYRLSKKNLQEQLLKTVMHELGHTQGLDHCPVKNCIMTDAEGKNKLDDEKDFCNKCKSFLVKKGFKL